VILPLFTRDFPAEGVALAELPDRMEVVAAYGTCIQDPLGFGALQSGHLDPEAEIEEVAGPIEPEPEVENGTVLSESAGSDDDLAAEDVPSAIDDEGYV